MVQTLSVTPMLLCSSLSFSELHGVAVAGGSGSGTGGRSGVAVGTGVGGTPGVGGGGGVAKIPRGSRSRRYISQVPLPSGGSGKQTHSHFSGQHSSRIHGSCCARSAVQYQTRASSQVYVLPRQSQQVFGTGVASGKQSTDARSGSAHRSWNSMYAVQS